MTDHRSALPSSLEVEQHGHVAVLRLRREHKRNAIDDVTVLGIEQFFSNLPHDARCVILDAAGDNFSAGLDLSSLSETSTFDGIAHSAMWHRIFQRIEFGRVPVIAVLKGAVVGGLELATTAHIRVAERSTFYALPGGNAACSDHMRRTARPKRPSGETWQADRVRIRNFAHHRIRSFLYAGRLEPDHPTGPFSTRSYTPNATRNFSRVIAR